MSSNGPFGFDPEEFDRVVREAGEGLRDALDGVSRFFTTSGERAPWGTIFDEFSRYTQSKTEPESHEPRLNPPPRIVRERFGRHDVQHPGCAGLSSREQIALH